MFRLPRHVTVATRSIRLYATQPEKPSIKLVADLRKLTEVSITKAREALVASGNDVQSALEWLKRDLATSGAKKAAKVAGRSAHEGLVSVSVLSSGAGAHSGPGAGGVRAAIVELNCETDFVGRNELFGRLAADIAHTAAFIAEAEETQWLLRPVSLDLLNDAPLISQTHPQTSSTATVGSAVRDTIAKVGEKITISRASAVVHEPLTKRPDFALRLASYVHGVVNGPSQGRIAALAAIALKSPRMSELIESTAFREDLAVLERALARQIVGFDTRLIRSSSDGQDETALYNQPFMTAGPDNGKRVQDALHSWARAKGLVKDGEEDGGLEVIEFAKWAVGEDN